MYGLISQPLLYYVHHIHAIKIKQISIKISIKSNNKSLIILALMFLSILLGFERFTFANEGKVCIVNDPLKSPCLA